MSLGIGLPDYTNPAEAAAAAANDLRLTTDPAFVAAELARAQAVIVSREAAGLDTSAQRNYLDRLQDLSAGGDWYESGQAAPAVAVASSQPATRTLTTTKTHTAATTSAGSIAPVSPAVPFGASALLPGFQLFDPAGPVVDKELMPVDLGKGLPDYTNPAEAAAAAANDLRLSTDPAFVVSEIARTKEVIKQRKAAGMETAGQEFYLKRLLDLQGGGDWYESGQTDEAYEIADKYGPGGQDQWAVVNPPARLAGFLGLPWWAWVAAGVVALIFGRKPSGE